MVLSHANDHFIYRGEDDTRYPLRPRFGRYKIKDSDNPLTAEEEILNEFKRRSVPYVTHSPANDWEWLALAQHFRLATRLLDWTENPLVAAFFATSNFLKQTDRVIYALKRNSIETPGIVASPFAIDAVVIYRPKHIDTRISAQMGLFTAHPNPTSPFTNEALERWIIKMEAVIKLNLTLDGYGFNQATMFPGLDGLAEHINEWYLPGLSEESE